MPYPQADPKTAETKCMEVMKTIAVDYSSGKLTKVELKPAKKAALIELKGAVRKRPAASVPEGGQPVAKKPAAAIKRPAAEQPAAAPAAKKPAAAPEKNEDKKANENEDEDEGDGNDEEGDEEECDEEEEEEEEKEEDEEPKFSKFSLRTHSIHSFIRLGFKVLFKVSGCRV